MKVIEGNIIDVRNRKIVKGRMYFDDKIISIVEDATINSDNFILPGLVDAHVHIESSMLTPLEYSKVAVKHGVVAAVTDPHEITNVCGVEGISFMAENAALTPMKIFVGAPSCVPATGFETSGANLDSFDIEELFENDTCFHLAEMMNFPGVIYDDREVLRKIEMALRYNKVIDGHAPMLSGRDLRKYVGAGISTDHECTTVYEALEKISLGMKIMLRESSAAKDFDHLVTLINTHSEMVMMCTDDCHPDELNRGYINKLVKKALVKGYDIFDVLQAAVITAVDHYDLPVGLMQVGESADFIVVDSIEDFNVLETYIDGNVVFSQGNALIKAYNDRIINQFYVNSIDFEDIKVPCIGENLNVIKVQDGSLLTQKMVVKLDINNDEVLSSVDNDILKIVVLNRYSKALPSVGFIKGFGLQSGAIAGTIAHDSHNIVAVGVKDEDILKAIGVVQEVRGGLVVVNDNDVSILKLPVGGLMSDKSIEEVSKNYQDLSSKAIDMGCQLKAPFMTLAFMSLLVIPELKLGDRGLFDVSKFEFTSLQF